MIPANTTATTDPTVKLWNTPCSDQFANPKTTANGSKSSIIFAIRKVGISSNGYSRRATRSAGPTW
ncbi:hypothetical protein DRO31_05400 [Candidatus Bathyarchaeota archaeon]|nr:MAG: hypothetical protein DRO31_05400 [Candidatus Bathyarchaeota archaeon]